MDLKDILKKLKLSEQTISMVLGALVIVVVGVLIFNYFRSAEKGGIIKEPALQEEGQPIETGAEGEQTTIPEGLPTTYKTEVGDNLWKISLKFFNSGYNWVDIAKENNLENPSELMIGQELKIPIVQVRKPAVAGAKFGDPIIGTNYTVSKGDHLWGIAVRAYGDGYQWVKIAQANNLANPDLIYAGNVLNLPR